MGYFNDKKILSLIKTEYLMYLNGISLKNAQVNGNTLQLATNYVQDTTLYSFDTSVSGTTLEMETNNISNNTLILI